MLYWFLTIPFVCNFLLFSYREQYGCVFSLVGMWPHLFLHLYLGNVVGLSHYWLGGTQCRVKLIRVWLGDSDGLGALSNVCVRGSQPPAILLPPPQQHSTHCQPCSDCASLSPLPLSFTLLFSQLFLYVCASLSFSVPDPYCSIKKPYCSPIGILSAPMPVYNTSLRLGDLAFSAFRHGLKSHWWLYLQHF